MTQHIKHAHLPGRLVIVGIGSIGQAMLPLLLRHLDIHPEQTSIISADADGAEAARHAFGCGTAIYLNRPGAATRVRSWTPLEGAYHGFMVTHSESISIADQLTLRQDGDVRYRPTVHMLTAPATMRTGAPCKTGAGCLANMLIGRIPGSSRISACCVSGFPCAAEKRIRVERELLL